MYLVPAISYTLLVGICAAITWFANDTQHRLISTVLVVTIMALPSLSHGVSTGPPVHTGDHKTTVLLALLTFYLLSAGHNVWLAQLPLMFAMVGDPMAIWIGIPAIVVAGVVFLSRGQIRAGRQFLFSTAASLVAARVIVAAIAMLGGFDAVPGNIRNSFVTLDRFPRNARLLLEITLNLFGANPFGRDMSHPGTVIAFVHLGVLIFLIWVIWKVARIAVRKFDGLRLMMLTALILNLLAFLFSSTPMDLDSARYLPTFAVFGPVLVGLSWYEVDVPEKLLWLAAPTIAAAFMIPFCVRLAHPLSETGVRERVELAPTDPHEVIEFLESNHLTEGYGSYWSANILTVLSDGKIKVREVALGPEGKLVPLRWFSASQWYDMKNAKFLIFKDTAFDVSWGPAISMWGFPADNAQIDGYTILTWSRPLQLGEPGLIPQ